jgi:phytoene dehydrogenase-like protein
MESTTLAASKAKDHKLPDGKDITCRFTFSSLLDISTRALSRIGRRWVFKRLAKEMSADDIKEHIKFEIVYQPKVWKELFNLEKGAAFGLSHNFWQVGYLCPQNRHKEYKNLYFAGASTHPGTGLPIVLLSARLTTERILKEKGTISA